MRPSRFARLVPHPPNLLPELSPLFGLMLILSVVLVSFMPLAGRVLPVSLVPAEPVLVEGSAPPGQFIIRLTSEGTYLNGIPVPESALHSSLTAALAGRVDPTVALDAADDMPYERVVRVVEAIYAAGVRVIVLTPDLAAFVQSHLPSLVPAAPPAPISPEVIP